MKQDVGFPAVSSVLLKVVFGQLNTVLELECSADPISDLLNQSDELTFNKLLVTTYHGAHDSHVRCVFIRMDSPFTVRTAQYEEFGGTLHYFKMYNCGKKSINKRKYCV